MKYQVKRGYSYINKPNSKVAAEGTLLPSEWEVDDTQKWKLEPAKIVKQEVAEVPEKVTKDIGQQEPTKEPDKEVIEIELSDELDDESEVTTYQ